MQAAALPIRWPARRMTVDGVAWAEHRRPIPILTCGFLIQRIFSRIFQGYGAPAHLRGSDTRKLSAVSFSPSLET